MSYVIPRFRLLVEKTTYFPGEMVHGHLVLNLGKDTAFPLEGDENTIFIDLCGFTRTFWVESQSSSSLGSRIVHCGTERLILKLSKIVYQAPTGTSLAMTLGRKFGTFVWPFSFQLPRTLPPSFKAPYPGTKKLEYVIHAKFLLVAYFLFVLQSRTTLNLRSHLQL